MNIKLITLFVLLGFSFGCGDIPRDENGIQISNDFCGFASKIIVEEHEYIYSSIEGTYVYSHSGECKKCWKTMRLIVREELDRCISNNVVITKKEKE